MIYCCRCALPIRSWQFAVNEAIPWVLVAVDNRVPCTIKRATICDARMARRYTRRVFHQCGKCCSSSRNGLCVRGATCWASIQLDRKKLAAPFALAAAHCGSSPTYCAHLVLLNRVAGRRNSRISSLSFHCPTRSTIMPRRIFSSYSPRRASIIERFASES